MRALAFSAVTVLFLSTVYSKISFGRCRQDVPRQSFLDYEIAMEGFDPLNHRVIAMDKGFMDTIDFIEQIGFQMPFDYVCDDLNTVQPFKKLQ
jgi:hypothetical protein